MSHLVISLTYDVLKEYREPFLDAMRRVRTNSLDLGAVDYVLLEDDAHSNHFTEILVYDSWVQYDRARTTPPSLDMEEIFAKLDTWIDGGTETVQVRFMKTLFGGWEGAAG